MKKKLFIISSLLVLVLVCGCTQTPDIASSETTTTSSVVSEVSSETSSLPQSSSSKKTSSDVSVAPKPSSKPAVLKEPQKTLKKASEISGETIISLFQKYTGLEFFLDKTNTVILNMSKEKIVIMVATPVEFNADIRAQWNNYTSQSNYKKLPGNYKSPTKTTRDFITNGWGQSYNPVMLLEEIYQKGDMQLVLMEVHPNPTTEKAIFYVLETENKENWYCNEKVNLKHYSNQ